MRTREEEVEGAQKERQGSEGGRESLTESLVDFVAWKQQTEHGVTVHVH